MILDAPDEEPKVQFFRWRIPVGDFKPWFRLLIMLAMLMAVSIAARRLSRHLQQAKIEERIEQFLEADERVATSFRPLYPLTGFPHSSLATAGNLNLQIPEGAARRCAGRVVDAAGKAVAGAVVSACGSSVKCNENGAFDLGGLPPRGALTLRIIPPASRADLGILKYEIPGDGLPGYAVPAGRLVLPSAAAGAELPLTVESLQKTAGASISFESRPGAAGGESLDGWEAIPAGAPAGADVRRRDLIFTKDAAVLGAVYHFGTGANARAANSPQPFFNISGECKFNESESPDAVQVAVDLYSSGVWSSVAAARRENHYQFELVNVPAGEHRIIAFAPGWLPRCIDAAIPLPADPSSSSSSLTLELERAAEMELRLEGAAPGTAADYAVRITGPNVAKTEIAFPENGVLPLRHLPPSACKFELLVPRSASAPLQRSLEHTGEPVFRTLEAGRRNLNLTFHAPREKLPLLEPVAGRTRARAHVYRSGARFDEPHTFTRAGETGEFTIFAARGERVYFALGNPPFLLPFATGVAGDGARLEASTTVEVAARPGDEVEWILTGPNALGRAQIHKTADATGRVIFDGLPPDSPFLLQCDRDGATLEMPGATTAPGETVKLVLDGAVKS